MSQALFLFRSGLGAPALNMAMDETLLESAPRLKSPVLRFYGWTAPAATFGYFQKYRDLEALTPLRPLIRRPTGGGLVPHDADWTYSLSVPTLADWYLLAAIESYRRMHEWIRDSLKALNLDAELAPDCNASGPGQCFAGYEKFDVLVKGKKIAGAAQRRTRSGLLIQGSVQPPRGTTSREAWQAAMEETAKVQGFSCVDLPVDDLLIRRANELVAEKYSQVEYNQKR